MALDPAEYHALLRLLAPERFDAAEAFADAQRRDAAIRDAASGVARALADGQAPPKAVLDATRKALADDPDDAAKVTQLGRPKLNPETRRAVAREVLDALQARHGLAEFVVRNRRGPVGGLPERKPQIFPLEATDAQAALLEAGEAVMLELARTIDDASERAATLGKLYRALWASPRALADIVKPISGVLALELAPYVAKVAAAPLDREGLPTADARLRWLVRYIRRLGAKDKVLVFVETSVAVRALKDALEPCIGKDIAVFHAALAPRDQDRQVAWFRDADGPQVMLSTEAGGEGRNFQFCHRVVLYDLPWRPATVEQRIGRVDRVGQAHDVEVLVPFFKGGFEAAILRIMQEAIGVLDATVGGIDHALEYVSDDLAALILEGADSERWKDLFRRTEALVEDTRRRINEGIDPILDHASFSPTRAAAQLATAPEDLEQQLESFVRGYADHSKLELHSRSAHVVGVEGAPGAKGSMEDASYVGSFSRTYALDHEDVEFLSFGHPLVDHAVDWAVEGHETSAALALCRGFDRDGAIFLWTFGLDIPEGRRDVAAYFDASLYHYAIDEAGEHHAAFDGLLLKDRRPFDRMDPTPLRASLGRWRALVDRSCTTAQRLADKAVDASIERAEQRLEQVFAARLRHLRRQQRRELERLGTKAKPRDKKALEATQNGALEALAAERERIVTGIRHCRPRLITGVAVRLMKARAVSA